MVAWKHTHYLLAAALATGCTTITSYKPQSEARAARAADYPIYVYPSETKVPRPYEVVGFMTIRDTPLTVFGGSLEGEIDELRTKARKVGADAVKLTSVEKPDFLHSKHRVEANIIRFRDEWETFPYTESEFAAYLEASRATLDPIEGIWSTTDAMQSRVAIMKSSMPRGRDFAGFILNSSNPTWRRGDKKVDLKKGERPGVYRGFVYLDDYQRHPVAFTLRGAQTNTFFFKLSDDLPPIIVTKE